MKKVTYALGFAILCFACSENKSSTQTEVEDNTIEEVSAPADDGKGVGPIKSVTLTNPLDAERISKGKAIYEMKCQACHRLDDQRVVGPGWKGVTTRRKPEWIMNLMLNVDEMIQKDAEAQKLYEVYLTKMPNQNLSEDDARNLLEFMRQNDGAQ
jgi:cytochrome c551/c552